MPSKAPHTSKDNFWSKLRVERDLTIAEVAEMVNIGKGRMSMIFSGQLMPPDKVIRELCSLFDVDYTQGQLEFQHAHRDWKADYSRKLVATGTSRATEPVVVSNDPNKTDEVLRLLYKQVDYDTFMSVFSLIKK